MGTIASLLDNVYFYFRAEAMEERHRKFLKKINEKVIFFDNCYQHKRYCNITRMTTTTKAKPQSKNQSILFYLLSFIIK